MMYVERCVFMDNQLEHTGRMLIYQNEKGDTKIDVYFSDETIWMTQKTMCELYQIAKSSVSEHIKNIFLDGELDESSTVRKFRTVQVEGTRQVTRNIEYYNLDMILAVGYRVRSHVGIHFRKWASEVLTEYMKKGFVLNDERLRNPKEFGADYFDELLERIRDIRASEKWIWENKKRQNLFAGSAFFMYLVICGYPGDHFREVTKMIGHRDITDFAGIYHMRDILN